MSANSNKFGSLFSWSSFGESHGTAMGVVIDGCPSGVPYDEKLLLGNLAKRRPGFQKTTSQRVELDQPEILSGVFQNKTLGTPIAVMVRNHGQRSEDYEEMKNQPRVGHADDLWQKKFKVSDHRGGGRASARETINWVIAGSFAQMFVKQDCPQVEVKAKLIEVGGEPVEETHSQEFIKKMQEAMEQGQSYGGLIRLVIENPPTLIGEPIFKKIKSQLAHAFMTINACTGIEIGGGFALARQSGTELHQSMENPNYGGVRGGIATGESIRCQLAFKPTSSIRDVAKKGRHDPCVAVRAVPVVEAMAWNVVADLLLAKRLN